MWPPIPQQQGIVAILDRLSEETQRLATLCTRKLAALEALKKSLLQRAFSHGGFLQTIKSFKTSI
jgi:type I restriction enzyme S subunit